MAYFNPFSHCSFSWLIYFIVSLIDFMISFDFNLSIKYLIEHCVALVALYKQKYNLMMPNALVLIIYLSIFYGFVFVNGILPRKFSTIPLF